MAKLELRSLIRKLNSYCNGALENAAGLCMARSHYEVTIDHMLLKLVDNPQADVQHILRYFEVEPARIIGALQHNVEGLRAGNTGKPVFSPLLPKWFEQAWLLGSINLGQPVLRSGTLLLALLESPSQYLVGGEVLELEAVDPDLLAKEFRTIVGASAEALEAAVAAAAPDAAGRPGAEGAAPTGEGALGRFCIDFTARAKQGEIDPVFGRDRE
ncbi:MAG TPA: type VI secretion system ATPase TssH, partial [Acidobacteriota bacterium]|nr:type VI secretion system ATPase TssH [Acidobacteriota bacterium]